MLLQPTAAMPGIYNCLRSLPRGRIHIRCCRFTFLTTPLFKVKSKLPGWSVVEQDEVFHLLFFHRKIEKAGNRLRGFFFGKSLFGQGSLETFVLLPLLHL